MRPSQPRLHSQLQLRPLPDTPEAKEGAPSMLNSAAQLQLAASSASAAKSQDLGIHPHPDNATGHCQFYSAPTSCLGPQLAALQVC